VGLLNIGLKLIALFSIPLEATAPYFLPALNDAFAQNDLQWLKKAFKKYFQLISIYSVLTFLFMSLLGGYLVDFWMGKQDLISQSDMLAFAFFTLANVFIYFISYSMLSSRFIFFLAKIYPITVLIITLIKWFIVPEYSIAGVLYTQSILLILLFVIPSLIKLKNNNLL
jgi:O-antigen/teichoic acid export membrane protein